MFKNFSQTMLRNKRENNELCKIIWQDETNLKAAAMTSRRDGRFQSRSSSTKDAFVTLFTHMLDQHVDKFEIHNHIDAAK